jgi:hypothetical protein
MLYSNENKLVLSHLPTLDDEEVKTVLSSLSINVDDMILKPQF